MDTYAKKALEFLKRNGKITHQDIMRETYTNCPHSTLRSLKRLLKDTNMSLLETWSESSKTIIENGEPKEVKKRFKTYFLQTNECK